MNTELVRFISLAGGLSEAMKTLRCSRSQLMKMKAGERGVTPERARIIIREFPEISFMKLVLPDDK